MVAKCRGNTSVPPQQWVEMSEAPGVSRVGSLLDKANFVSKNILGFHTEHRPLCFESCNIETNADLIFVNAGGGCRRTLAPQKGKGGNKASYSKNKAWGVD